MVAAATNTLDRTRQSPRQRAATTASDSDGDPRPIHSPRLRAAAEAAAGANGDDEDELDEIDAVRVEAINALSDELLSTCFIKAAEALHANDRRATYGTWGGSAAAGGPGKQAAWTRQWMIDNDVWPGHYARRWTIAFLNESGRTGHAYAIGSAAAKRLMQEAGDAANHELEEQRKDTRFVLKRPAQAKGPYMDEVVIQGLYRKKYRQVTSPDTFNDFIKDAYMVEEDSFAANQGWSAELRFVTYYVGQHGLMTRFLRNIQHMTSPCGVHATAAVAGFFPGTLVISGADCLWAHSEVERSAMEKMGTYPNASNGKRFLAKHANLRGANRSKGNGDVTTYCMAGDLPFVKKLQPLISERLERAGPRVCEHASCSRAPYWGSAEDRQKRWCQAHRGDDSVCLHHAACEGCGEKEASFSMADGKRRWCAGCKHEGATRPSRAKKHDGARRAVGKTSTRDRWPRSRRKCEDCDKKQASFGMEGEPGRWWCAACAREHHPGAVDKTRANRAVDKTRAIKQKGSKRKRQ